MITYVRTDRQTDRQKDTHTCACIRTRYASDGAVCLGAVHAVYVCDTKDQEEVTGLSLAVVLLSENDVKLQ